jgi:hypothetical protein
MPKLENLVTSDSWVVMLRLLPCEQTKRVERGLDPINVERNPNAARSIPTSPEYRAHSG